MENFKKFTDIDFEIKNNDLANPLGLKQLKDYLKALNNCFDKEQNNFAEIVYYVYQVNGLFSDYNQIAFGRVYTKKNQDYTFDSIMEGFGFDRTQVCRLINTYDKFIDNGSGSIRLKKYICEFSKSKIFELLQVDEEQLQKDISNSVIRPDMSVKKIREYVKNYKALQKQKNKLSEETKEDLEDIVEEEIPPAYDPTKHYDFAYFECQTKAQLLNIIWELQKEYERLIKRKKRNEVK